MLAFLLPAARPATAECPELTSAFDAAIKAQIAVLSDEPIKELPKQ